MPRTRSLAWAELKIGILAVLAIGIAATVIAMVGNQGGFFWQRYALRTQFDDVQGLKEGAVVRVAGVEVGTVTSIRFEGAAVEVAMELSDDMMPRITSESRASIGSLSLLGEPVIDITAAVGGTPLEDGGVVPASPSAARLSDVAESAQGTLGRVGEVLDDIRDGEGTVGRLFTDPALYDGLRAFVTSGTELADGLNRGDGTLGRLLRDGSVARSLESSMANLDQVLARVRAGEGSIGALLQDDAFATALAATTRNFDELSARLNRGEGTAGRLLNDSQLYERMTGVFGRLDEITTRLDSGEGTAGQLLRDDALYENMNQAVAELRNLLTDVREDPKRFLNIRVSIF